MLRQYGESHLKTIMMTLLCVICFVPMYAHADTQTITMNASWYGPGLQGNTMANGETFDMNDPQTAAHKKLPFGTLLVVTNLANGRQLLLEVRDRGPYHPERHIDVSRAAALHLGFKEAGVATLLVQVLEP